MMSHFRSPPPVHSLTDIHHNMKGARGFLFFLLLLCSAPLGWGAVDPVGVLLRPVGDETNAWLAKHVLGAAAAREERLGADDPFHQHQAVRRLRSSGCCGGGAMLMSSGGGCPQQASLPLVLCPSLLRPDTTRAALDLIRDLGWRDLIYISNQPQQGLERLQMMFRVGYGALRLRLQGLTSQGLSSGGRHRVLLDLPPPLAADLLIRRAHVTPADDNHYLLMQPTLPDFWLLPELRVLKVFGFTFSSESRLQMPPPFPHPNLTVENYYFHDAALFARKAMEQRPLTSIKDILQKVVVSEGGLSGGGVRFSAQGTRADVNLTVMYTTADNGVQKYGWWSDAGKVGGLRRSYPPPPRQGALSQVQEKMIFRITSRLRAPFLVRNATGGLEGFCGDLAHALCDELDMRCELGLAADGLPGHFDGATWSGMVGELVTGRADLAVGDLVVTGARQRAVDFLEPFLEGHLSLLMARPSPSSPSLAPSAWGCAALAAALVAVALLVLGGPPDTIEAASALWRNKLSPSTAAWLVLGSATLQPTGVYPRSLASRVLVVSWWLFTGFFACMFLASLAAQLRLRAADKSPQMEQLQALSFQAILKEAVENGWPEIGVLSHSYTEKSIQASGVPLLREVARVARRVSSLEEGEALVLGGGGGFALLTESAYGDPCHTVSVHSTSPHASFAPALSPRLQPQLRAKVSAAYELLSSSGGIGHLHRKWWGNQCHHDEVSGGQGTSAWRPLALLFGALVVLALVFAAQYALKVRSKHSRRQQLTFEDIHFDQRLPTPPPELLPPPPPTHEVPEIQQGSVNGAESFQDFFERMRTGSS